MLRSRGTPIVGLLLWCAGLVWLGLTGYRTAVEQAHAPQDWLPVAGRVVAATIEVDEEHDEYHSVYYYPRLTYAYEVGGRQWRGTRIHVHGDRSCSTREAAQAVLDRFPATQPLTVFVDPADPSRATLLFDGSSMPYLLCLVAALFLALPVLSLLLRAPPAARTLGLAATTLAWWLLLAWTVRHWWQHGPSLGPGPWVVGACSVAFAGLGVLLLLMAIGSVRRGAGRSSSVRG